MTFRKKKLYIYDKRHINCEILKRQNSKNKNETLDLKIEFGDFF